MLGNCTGFVLLLLCLFTWRIEASAGGDPQEKYQLHIYKTDEKITVDGKLREPAWKNAEVATDFWMSFPVDDRPSALQTEVRVCYDDDFLYVSAICHDPNTPVIQTLKRDIDFWRGDGFAVLIDPHNEKTNGFVFGVNPYGVQMEALISGYTGSRGGRPTGINEEWDNKWFSKTEVHSNQWIAEIAIPLKSLRYDESKTTWGVNFIRSEMSDNSFHSWSPIPVQFRSVDLSFTGAMKWDTAPRKAKGNLSVIPYITGGINQDFEEDQDGAADFNAGVDAKIAVTSSLNLDLTINPDFSQVEVDEQITNLSRFSIRLPEKRLFFLENNDIFEDFGNSPARPFFSRRIGLDEDGNTIPILYGARLTGNVTKDLRIGLLNMHTRSTDDFLAQNYTASAFRQKVLSRSIVKGFFLNRQAIDGTDFMKNDYGRNAGLEFNYYSDNNKWGAWTGYNHSFKPDIDSKNYYYKLGTRYNTRNISATVNWYEVQENYFLDMGFLGNIEHYDAVRDTTFRVGFGSFFTDIEFKFYPKEERKFTSHGFSLFNWTTFMADGKDLLERRSSVSYEFNFPGRSTVRMRATNAEINLLYPFTFTDAVPLPPQRYRTNSVEVDYRSDSRKALSYDLEVQYGGFYSGTRFGVEAEIKYRIQPWGNFGLKFDYNDLQFGGEYGERKLFAVSPRIEFSFSNNLFWTTFIQYNSQAENFNVNSRLQWRYSPMSDIFLVYTDNYFVLTDDFADNFRISTFGPKNRAIVFKVNYWLTL